MKIPSIRAITLCALVSTHALSAVNAENDFSQHGNQLTPTGATQAGNAEGSIPQWTGGLTKPPEGWTPEQGHINPYKDDKILFTIT